MIDQANKRHRHVSAVVGAPSWRDSSLHHSAASLSDTALSDTATSEFAISETSRTFVEGYLAAGITGFTCRNTKRHNPCAAHSQRARPT